MKIFFGIIFICMMAFSIIDSANNKDLKSIYDILFALIMYLGYLEQKK